MATPAISLTLRRMLAATVFLSALGVFTGDPTARFVQTNVGYVGPTYGPTSTAVPTGEKPQSKLWWNDGAWWGSLYSAPAQRYRIFRLDTGTQTWVDTGVAIDDRPNSKSDALWDDATQKLYIASNSYSSSPGATSTVSKWARLYRFSYDTASNTYSLDAGFPVAISRGTAEALTIARDSAGRLWATWVQNSTVMVSHSTSSDLQWSLPFTLPAGQGTAVSSDDISAVIAFGGTRIGVMWSNQNADQTYFAVHQDADPPTTWQPAEVVVPGPGCSGLCADDHINLKTDSQGRVFAALKTSLSGGSSPLTLLAVRGASGGWAAHTFGLKSDAHTRPVVVLNEQQGRLYVFATSPEAGGAIYYKSTPTNNIAFPPGRGTLFISNASDSDIGDPTSGKTSVTAATGLVVVASSSTSRTYYHNVMAFSGGAAVSSFSPGSGTPGTLVTITGTGLTGSSEVLFGQAASSFSVISDTEIRATVPGGATTGRITVTTPSGVAVSATDFVVTLPPVVRSFTPTSGPTGTSVTISGDYFTGATQVTFAGVPAAFGVVTSGSISASVPSGATTGRIGVTTPSGNATSSTDFVVTTGSGQQNRLRDVTFEGGLLVDLATGADRVNGSVALETGSPLKGAYSARVPGAGDSYLEVRFTAVDDVFLSMDILLLALPASDVRLLQLSNAGTTVGNVMLSSNGTLRLRSGSTAVGAVSAPLTVGQRYRIGLRQKRGSGGNGILEAFVAIADTSFGPAFAATQTGTWTTAADRLRFGATTSAQLNALLDSVLIDAASMPPPLSNRPEPTP